MSDHLTVEDLKHARRILLGRAPTSDYVLVTNSEPLAKLWREVFGPEVTVYLQGKVYHEPVSGPGDGQQELAR
jgi:hypothetical protein